MVSKIKKLCEENNMNLTVLERELGLSKSSIRLWDKNTPSVEKAQKVADYFGVTLDYLVGATDDPHSYAEITEDEKAFYDAYTKASQSDKATVQSMMKIINKLLGVDEK